ncbi:MAG: TetR/AcrR family transcriptional regulator [Rhizorhabdus sp.]|nr:TetR/AcrR family transcriptional regulator [Rhizorhabdus sp.]
MTAAPDPISAPSDSEDFRVRVAAQRRGKMRARLLDALLDIHGTQRSGVHLVIDDVIRAADVSRGTFYKYFESLEEAVAALGEQLASEMMADFQRLFGDEPDPAVRAFGGSAMTIARAWHDPRWGSFTSRVDYVDFFDRQDGFDLIVRSCLVQAREQGQMRFASLDAALDLVIGSAVEGQRRMVRGYDRPRAYVDALLGQVYAGLGMAPDTAAAAMAAAWGRIVSGAPGLGWWPAESKWG